MTLLLDAPSQRAAQFSSQRLLAGQPQCAWHGVFTPRCPSAPLVLCQQTTPRVTQRCLSPPDPSCAKLGLPVTSVLCLASLGCADGPPIGSGLFFCALDFALIGPLAPVMPAGPFAPTCLRLWTLTRPSGFLGRDQCVLSAVLSACFGLFRVGAGVLL